jgi:RimJ/RimL family protein N-acetyltransferase
MTYAGHWQIRGYGRWMVEDKATGETLGNVGLWYPEGWPEPEIGWTLFEGAEGAAWPMRRRWPPAPMPMTRLGWTTAISLVAADNTAPAALAERMGATRDGDLRP